MYVNSENIDDIKDANIYENLEELAIYSNVLPVLPAHPVLPDTKHIDSNSVLTELIVDVLNPQHSPSDSSKNEKVTPDGSSSGISSGNSSSIESPQLSPSDSIHPDSGTNCPVSRSPDSGIFGLLRPVLTPPEAVTSDDHPIRNCIHQTLEQFEKLEEESNTLIASARPHSGIPETMPSANEDPHSEESDINIEFSFLTAASSSAGSASSDDEEYRCKNPSGPDGIFTAALVALVSPQESLEPIPTAKTEIPEAPEEPEEPEALNSPRQLLSQAERNRLDLMKLQKVKLKRIDSWYLADNDDIPKENPIDGSSDQTAAISDTSFVQSPLDGTPSAAPPTKAVSTTQFVQPPLDAAPSAAPATKTVSTTQFVYLPPESAQQFSIIATTQLIEPPLDVIAQPNGKFNLDDRMRSGGDR